MTIMGNTIGEWLIALGIAIPLMIYSRLTISYVFMCMWEWFISIPFGLDTIAFKTAMCICLVVGFLNSRWTYMPTEEVFKYLRYTIVSPLITLTMAYLIHIIYING